ncbi:DUF2806 domain-containing protein [Hoeflea alexandrii]|uniref:DUF2806 domain-containing protein n=1 Tax=Hoeflea alexandrii TaxID=288436 RepID=UPI0035CF4E5A
MDESEETALVNARAEVNISPTVDLGDDPLGLKQHGGGFYGALKQAFSDLTIALLHKPRVRAEIVATKDKLKFREELIQGGFTEETANALVDKEWIGLQRHERKIEIAQRAIEHFRQEEMGSSDDFPILDPDWVNQFWRYAEDISNEDVKEFWGLLLARVAQGRVKPNKRLLHFVSTLEPDEARELQRLSKFAISYARPDGTRISGILVYFYSGGRDRVHPNPGALDPQVVLIQNLTNRLRSLIGTVRQEVFGPIGILRECNVHFSFSFPPGIRKTEIAIGNVRFDLSAAARGSELPVNPVLPERLELGGVFETTPLGSDLFEMISVEADPDFIETFTLWAHEKGLRLERL